MTESYYNSVFWIEIDKIQSNPFQPRREFDGEKLQSLADSIRQYGVLQPLVVTRREVSREDGGFSVEYELIAGERRLRAAKIAGLAQLPALIRGGEEDNRLKLEIAIIENLQREDLNSVDRAMAFHQLVSEFSLNHVEIAKKIGKSREYVSNTLRILALPEEIRRAISEGKITEGHSRPILMLADRPEEQIALFREVMVKKLTVRETEFLARRVAYERVRNKKYLVDPEIIRLEQELTERLGTRVKVERRQVGGQVMIDFFSNDDLHNILALLNPNSTDQKPIADSAPADLKAEATEEIQTIRSSESTVDEPAEKSANEPAETEDNDLYNIKNFSV